MNNTLLKDAIRRVNDIEKQCVKRKYVQEIDN